MPHRTPAPVLEMTSNPLLTRTDMVNLLHSLLSPLHSALSTHGARVQLGHTGTHFDVVAAELEGFARALWGLAPLLAAEPDSPAFKQMREDWVKGLAAGVDEEGEEYWGGCIPNDQRFVEMAAISFSLAIAPNVFWDPLTPESKTALNKWLLQCNGMPFPGNNWRFFRVLVNLGLKLVGGEYSQQAIDDELDWIDTFYGEHGFPSDSPNATCKAYDYYATSFAIPFYGLIYARLASTSDPVRAARFRQRAIANIPHVVHLFAPGGEAIPFGRSMTYRFACSAFWAAVAFDELELPPPFTWGVVKGLVLRNIRWFTQKDEIFRRDGSLSIGWAYPSLFMSEDYNSPQSPYWALKAFLVLALPQSHPFWIAGEEPYPAELLSSPYHVMKPWMQVFSHAAGHTFCLSSGQWVLSMPCGPYLAELAERYTSPCADLRPQAKYGKLAYSAQFGFSVPTGSLGLQQVAPDSELALSDDSEGERWVTRRQVYDVEISDSGVIRSKWRPWPDVEATTWLISPPKVDSPFHTRIHRIMSSRPLLASDGGFAINSHTGPSKAHERRMPILSDIPGPIKATAPSALPLHGRLERPYSALASSKSGVSGIVDLLGSGIGKVQDADGNSNLISPRTVISLVLSEVRVGETWLASRVFGLPFANAATGKGDGVDEQWERKWLGMWKAVDGERYRDVEEVFRAVSIEP